MATNGVFENVMLSLGVLLLVGFAVCSADNDTVGSHTHSSVGVACEASVQYTKVC